MCVIGLENWASQRYFPSFWRNRLFSVVVATNFLDLSSVLNAKFSVTNNFRSVVYSCVYRMGYMWNCKTNNTVVLTKCDILPY